MDVRAYRFARRVIRREDLLQRRRGDLLHRFQRRFHQRGNIVEAHRVPQKRTDCLLICTVEDGAGCAADRGAWYDRDLFAAQPFELFGVKCDERLRGLRDGRAVENLYAIGAGLAGFNPVKEGCGAGVSMLTALAAAERILNE